MELSSSSKIITAVALASCASMFVYFQNTNIEEKKIAKESVEVKPTKNKVNDIEIVYLKDTIEESPTNKNLKDEIEIVDLKENIIEKEIYNKEFTKQYKNSVLKRDIDSETTIQKDEPIKKYIERRKLLNIATLKNNIDSKKDKKVTRFSVYSNITPAELKKNINSNFPPSAPSIVKGTFSSGEQFTVIIPAEVQAQASELIVTSNYDDGTIEEMSNLKETTNDEDKKVILPPSIGQ